MAKLFLIIFLSIPLFTIAQISMVELEVRDVPQPKQRDTAVERWNQSQSGYEKLPAQAKENLYWTNFARNNPQTFWDSVVAPSLIVFSAFNKPEAKTHKVDLLKAGRLPMFGLNQTLIKTAQSHASDIAYKKSPLSHNSTNGIDFGTRIRLAGIKYCANENISLSSQSILLSVLLLYLDIGVPGLGHRKALLDQNLREIGVGSALYGKDQYFLVQDLACAQQ